MNKKSLLKKIAITFLVIICLAVGGFLFWANQYYKADDIALAVNQQSNVITTDNVTTITSSTPTDTAIIFYPGAKVEAIAYLPLLDQLADNGYDCYLIHMPLNMAIFDSNAATSVIENTAYEHYYIMGHSMGGAMASNYAYSHQELIDGLILLGAYPYKDYSEEKTCIIYGSLNQSVEDELKTDVNVFEIEGGNHAQFGNYGHQKGDEIATISAQQQQDETVDIIIDFIK